MRPIWWSLLNLIRFLVQVRMRPSFAQVVGWCGHFLVIFYQKIRLIPLKTNEYPLKIDGWKMIHFRSNWSLFRWHVIFFAGGTFFSLRASFFSLHQKTTSFAWNRNTHRNSRLVDIKTSKENNKPFPQKKTTNKLITHRKPNNFPKQKQL